MSIQNELQELVSKGLITEEQAINITRYYQSSKKSLISRLTLMFAAISAILIGLAVVLILAHNWEDMHRYTKIGVAFLPLVLSQMVAGYTLRYKSNEPIWKETSAIFIFFSLGTCMALIAQIYHIEDTRGMFYLTWAGLSIPVIYILGSCAMSILSILCLTYFNMHYAFDRLHHENDFFYYVGLLAILPYYISLVKEKPTSNTTYIHHWIVALSVTLCTAALAYTAAYTMFLMYAAMFSMMYNIGRSPYLDHEPLWANAYSLVGQVGLSVVLIFLSFESVWSGIYAAYNIGTLIYSREILMTVLYGAFGIYVYFKYKSMKAIDLIDFYLIFIPLSLIFLICYSFYPSFLINVLTLALGVSIITRSVAEESLGTLNFGLLVIAILILCRFFDTDMSYLIRGLVFAFLGVGFFVANYFMIKKFRENET